LSTATLQQATKSVDEVPPIQHLQAHELPFDQIMRRYGGMVYNKCLGITRNRHDAEDATQAVFLTLAMHLQSAKTIKYLGPWLEQVATRTALNLIRSRKRRDKRENTVAELAKPETIDPDKIDGDEIRAAVREELNQIPARYRMPLILHYFGESSTEEVAKELGITANALCVRLHRGRQMLRERLSKRGITISAIGLGIILSQIVRFAIYEQIANPVTQTAVAMAAGHVAAPPIIGQHVVAMAHSALKPALSGKIKLAALLMIVSAGTLFSASRLTALGDTFKSNLLQNPVESIRDALPSSFDLISQNQQNTPRKRHDPVDIKPTEIAVGAGGGSGMQVDLPQRPGALPPVERLADAGTPRGVVRGPIPGYVQPDYSAPLASRSYTQDPTYIIPTPGVSQPIVPSRDDRFRSQDNDLDRQQFAFSRPPGSTDHTPRLPGEDPDDPFGTTIEPPPGTLLPMGIQVTTLKDNYQWPRDNFPPQGSRHSIDLTFNEVTQAGPLVLTELDRSDYVIFDLPEGHSFISIWSMSAGVQFDKVSLGVNYNEDVLAGMGLNEANIKLWVFDGSIWSRIDDGRDIALNKVWGDTTGGQYIAISTPEPGTIAVAGLALGYALLRRRRNT
jgi:RNA polymerase sigma factor (sigma-70 family)